MRFEATASLRRCDRARGFVLEGALRGNGVLVWLRGGDSLPPPGRYPVLARGDTLSPRGAVVAVRFMTGDLAHGVVLDSGGVTVTVSGRRRISAAVGGAGLETTSARRVGVEAEFVNTAPAADSARCDVQP